MYADLALRRRDADAQIDQRVLDAVGRTEPPATLAAIAYRTRVHLWELVPALERLVGAGRLRELHETHDGREVTTYEVHG